MNRTAMVVQEAQLPAAGHPPDVPGAWGRAYMFLCRVRVFRLQMDQVAIVRKKRSRLLLATCQAYQVRGAGLIGSAVVQDFKADPPLIKLRWGATGAAACWPLSARRARCLGQDYQWAQRD